MNTLPPRKELHPALAVHLPRTADAVFPAANCHRSGSVTVARRSGSWLARARFFCHFAAACLVTAHIVLVPTATAAEWRLALPGWQYRFPADHGAHPDFRTEWWYFTGNLRDESGRREFGYQLTWFRHGVRREAEAAHDAAGIGENDSVSEPRWALREPPSLPSPPSQTPSSPEPRQSPAARSRFLVRDLKFAHFAVSDLREKTFFFTQKISRGAFGEAGFGAPDGDRLAWIDGWQLALRKDGAWTIHAAGEGRELRLVLVPAKPPVIHGKNGVSQKAEGVGRASHYYSLTRLETTGELRLPGGAMQRVAGESWFDHEWATNQLAENQAGWDWFSIQLAGGSELMLYQLRTRDGGVDPASSGTWVNPDGTSLHLRRDRFILTPLDWWKSERTGTRYPVRWRVEVPDLGLRLDVRTPLEKQELALEPITYWEGAVTVEGTLGGVPVRGQGYLELTGYGGALRGISSGGR